MDNDPALRSRRRDRRDAPTRCRRPTPEALERRDLPAAFGTLNEYAIPTPASRPWDVAVSPDGTVWFTESAGNKVGRIDAAGRLAEFALPTTDAVPSGIVAAAAGAAYAGGAYFAESAAGKVGRITADGVITEGAGPSAGARYVDLALLSPDAARVTQDNGAVVPLFDLSVDPPAYTPPSPTYPQPTSGSAASGNGGVAYDGDPTDTRLYFTERDADAVGVYRIDTNGFGYTTTVTLPAGSRPTSIVVGPDGAAWYTAYGRDRIGRIDRASLAVTEYALAAGSAPWGIATGPGGVLYFTEYGGNALGRLDPRSGAIEVDPLPRPGSGPRGIAVSPDGTLWFAEADGNRIGQYLLNFAPQQTFATGLDPNSVAAGDFNGDGKPDLAVANYVPNTVSVLLDTTAAGAATPSFAPQRTFVVGDSAISVAVGDFNGDGKPDLAVSDEDDATVSVLLNTTAAGAAAPSFAPQQTFATGVFPFFVSVGDFNGDGKLDLAVANRNDDTVSVLLNATAAGAAAPSFAPQQTFATGSEPASVSVGDFNGDGKPDLAVANSGEGSVSVLLNSTAATFNLAPQRTFATGGTPFFVSVADFNRDGKPDLATSNQDDGTISVLLNTTAAGAATPRFAPQQVFGTGGGVGSLAVGDFNGDGKPDLAVANNGNAVLVLLNTTATGAATPSFANPKAFGVGNLPASVSVGDFNGDGRPDLAVANGADATVSVLLNTTPATAPARAGGPVAAYLRDAAARLIGRPLTDGRLDDLFTRVGPAAPGPPRPTPPRPLRLRLARVLVAGPEHRARVAHDLYLATLRREPGAAAVAGLQAGGSSRALRAALLGSDEYFQNLGGGTPAGFVAAAYRDVLGREPTAAEERRWGRLPDAGASRRAMAARLLVRPEARASEVDRLYRRLLGRPARPAEVAAWVARPSVGPAGLAVALLSSAEYLRQVR